MTDNPTPHPAFQLGICMAGAVSAGAYTAGVMDYLLEALATYEKTRDQNGFPSHKIEIPVMGGASAGGMTAIITAAALQQGITPVTAPLPDPQQERPENILYHSWVDLTAPDMFTKMLATDDIGSEVVSALNCEFIDEVAQRAYKAGRGCCLAGNAGFLSAQTQIVYYAKQSRRLYLRYNFQI